MGKRKLNVTESPRTKPKLRLEANGLINDIHEDAHDGVVHSHLYQPDRTQQFRGIEDIRNSGIANGAMEFLIPPEDYHFVLPTTHPDLFHNDQKIRFEAWQKFKSDPASLKYRVKQGTVKYFPGFGKGKSAERIKR